MIGKWIALHGAYLATVAVSTFIATPAFAQVTQVKLETLHSFDWTDGAYPSTPLVKGPDGRLYSVTGDGGINITGSIFSVGRSGDFKLLYLFTGGADGAQGSSMWTHRGVIYGTTTMGGTNGAGTAFTVDPAGDLTTIHQCDGDCDQPGGPVVVSHGNFIGTSSFGGAWGSIYQLSPSGSMQVLYAFHNGSDEAEPNGAMLASDGNFYGTTMGWIGQNGTIWKLTPDGTFSTLYTFTGGADGGEPRCPPVEAPDGNLYGTASQGGVNGNGVIYQLTPAGQFSVVYTFSGGTDGASPVAALIVGKDGALYGSTYRLGSGGAGTIFKFTTGGQLTTIYSFSGSDGGYVEAPLLETKAGTFFGVASGGGEYSDGTVFKLKVKDADSTSDTSADPE